MKNRRIYILLYCYTILYLHIRYVISTILYIFICKNHHSWIWLRVVPVTWPRLVYVDFTHVLSRHCTIYLYFRNLHSHNLYYRNLNSRSLYFRNLYFRNLHSRNLYFRNLHSYNLHYCHLHSCNLHYCHLHSCHKLFSKTVIWGSDFTLSRWRDFGQCRQIWPICCPDTVPFFPAVA